ncbi:potassium channel subfamily K member 2-like [Lytechinus variegatus]|uniref:potassium channel subfamily K member 2-like n=1 Tax=Lytechinus variegatus TaxID=7654 RepID=UPI001BB20B3F|nr:potassium channel subfamily K member 2-like [Lytechinus variegatus]
MANIRNSREEGRGGELDEEEDILDMVEERWTDGDAEEEEAEMSVSVKTKWTISAFLLLIVLGYLFAGALVFRALERPAAVQSSQNFHDALRRLSTENECLEEEDIAEMMRILTTAIEEGGYSSGHPYASQLSTGTVNESFYANLWGVGYAFIFASTVVTTMGFGYTAPRTVPGEVFCIFYAVAGIFMTGGIVLSVGQILRELCFTRMTTWLRKCLKCCPKAGVVLAHMSLVFPLAILMLLPSTLIYFFTQPGWSFIDSFYYVFQITTTIGFGDLESRFVGIHVIPLYVIRFFLFTYLFFCLGVVTLFLDGFRDNQKQAFTSMSSRLSRHSNNKSRKSKVTSES